MPNTSGRLFCFGCSMTQYYWPTWADIAGTFWNKFENWGEIGAGNQFIFNSVIECDLKNKLDSNDTVVIMWSNPERHDSFNVNRWSHIPQVLDNKNLLAHCLDGYWLQTFSYIYAIDQLLTHRKIPYIMTSWIDYKQLDSKFHSMFENLISKIQYIKLSQKSNKVVKTDNVEKLYTELYNAVSGPDWPSLENIINNQYTTTPQIEKEIKAFWDHLKNDNRFTLASKTQLDSHPLPSEHLAIAKKVFPELSWNHELDHWAQDLDSKIKNGHSIKFDKNLSDRYYYNLGEKL